MKKIVVRISVILSMLIVASLFFVSCQITKHSESTNPMSDLGESSVSAHDATDTEVTPPDDFAEEADSETPTVDGALSTSDYSVSVVDGLCYLNFTEKEQSEKDSAAQNGDGSLAGAGDFLVFSSVADMKRAFRENTLTEEQRSIIRTKFNRTDNGYELCNLDQLVCPVLPEELAVETVYLYGRQYRFYASGAGEMAAGIVLNHESLYERQYQSFMEIIEEHTLIGHTTEEYDGVACEIYEFSTEVSRIQYVFMTLPSRGESTSQKVILRYVLSSETQPDKASATVPRSVYVYGDRAGVYYECTIQGVSQAPTVAWLSSFGLMAYTEVDGQPIS